MLTRIVLIYGESDLPDEIKEKKELLCYHHDPAKAYQIGQHEAAEFIDDKEGNGEFHKIFFTKNISDENVIKFSKEPYNGKQME